MSRPMICIKPQEFDEKLIVIMEPKVYHPKDSNLNIETSDIVYLNDKSELCDFYLILPQIETYGPSAIYKFNSKNKSSENVEGYSISYSHPDAEKVFDLINQVCQETIGKQYTLKLTFNHKNKVKNGVKTRDELRPKVAYFKLMTFKDYKTNEINISTKIYDQKSKQLIDPLDTVSKLGLIRFMVHVQKIYFGSHGNSGYNASIQVKLVKAYVQQMSSELPDFPSSDDE